MPVKVDILAVGETSLPVGPGAVKRLRTITYSADGAFPRIVYLEPAQDTPEGRRQAIAADLKALQDQALESLEIP